MVATPVVGSEITFSTDPTAEIPRVTALADDTFVLAWETATFDSNGTRLTGDLFARHLDETGNFTTGNFLARMTQFGHDRFFGDPLTTPLVVQQSDGSIMTEFALLGAGDTEVIGTHNVDANFTDAPLPFTVPKAANNHESLANSVATLHGTAVSFEVDDPSFNTHTFPRWYGQWRSVSPQR